MSSNWLTNFDIFLYANGSDDVQLWRLKKTWSLSSSASSSIMRLTSYDFEHVSEVEDHLKLIENMFQWSIIDYNNLINYISRRRLLVNGEGVVIAELFQYEEDANGLPVYFRSPGILSLNTYIPGFHNRAKVKDAVVAPPMVDSGSTLQDKLDKEMSNKRILAKRIVDLEGENKKLETEVTKLRADIATRTNEIADLETKNKTLETGVTKLKAHLTATTNEIADLEVENKKLEVDVTHLKADLATRANEIAALETENMTQATDMTKLAVDLATKTNEMADLEAENKALETDVTKLKAHLTTLESENKILETDVRKLKADLDTRTNEIANLETETKTMEADTAKLKANLAARANEIAELESKHKILAARTNEVWMKDFSATNWVGIESLNKLASVDTSFTVVQKKGYYANHDSSVIFVDNITNVSSRYWIQIMIGMNAYTAIEIEDLVPNKEKARFLVNKWSSFQSKGKTYAYHR